MNTMFSISLPRSGLNLKPTAFLSPVSMKNSLRGFCSAMLCFTEKEKKFSWKMRKAFSISVRYSFTVSADRPIALPIFW